MTQCTVALGLRPLATVHRVSHSTSWVKVLTVAQTETLLSHSWGPKKPFSTNAKLSLRCKEIEKLNQDRPEVSICFVETVLVWVSYGFLWVAFLPFVIYISRCEEKTLPWTRFQLAKTVLTVVLFCLEIVRVLLQVFRNGFQCDVTEDIPDASFVATTIKAATYILIVITEQLMRRKGVKTSGVPFVFWGLLGISSVLPLYVAAQEKTWCSTSTLIAVSFGLIWIQVFFRCFADAYKRDQSYVEIGEEPCPEENVSVLNRVTYNWLTPSVVSVFDIFMSARNWSKCKQVSLVVKCYKGTITSKVLWNQTKRLWSSRLVPRFLHNWNQVQQNLHKTRLPTPSPKDTEKTPLLSKKNNDRTTQYSNTCEALKPSLFKVLFKTYRLQWIEACCIKLLADLFNLLQPFILRELIDIVEKRGGEESKPVWVGYAFSVVLFVLYLLRTIFIHCAFNHMIMMGISAKTSLIGAIYRKSMTMSNSARKTATVGEITSLMSVDCQRIQDAFTYSQYTVSLPFITAVIIAQLYLLMDWVMFAGLAVVIITMATTGWIGRVLQRLQRQILTFKGSRMKILNEIINGIKVLKMYTWEKPFQKKVIDIRNEEIKRLKTVSLYSAINLLSAIHGPFMVYYVMIMIYTLTSSIHRLDAQTAFYALSLVNHLRGVINMTPNMVTGLVQGYASIKRCQSFLWKEDIDGSCVQTLTTGKSFIQIQDGNFTWDKDNQKPTLSNVSCHITKGQLCAVVGQVGAGKTSLLSAILGEINKLSGTVTIKGSVAYVPQEAWIQNLTLQENILFGKSMERKKYSKVLSACALLPDLKLLPGGDMTEIGEKGINISGGQKQRVSFARAVYSDADIYLLDDPLSAVDSHVGKHLFRNVIGNQGLLRKKTRILVTHGIHWLPMVDKIMVLNEGQVADFGSYEELISKYGPFAQILKSFIQEDIETDDEDDLEVRQMKEKILSDIESLTSGGCTSEGGLTSDKELTSDEADRRSIIRRRNKIPVCRYKSLFTPSQTATQPVEEKPEQTEFGKLVQEEHSQKGAVKFSVFKSYAKAVGYLYVLFVFFTIMIFQGLNVFSNYWLTFWTEDSLLKNTSLGHTDEYEKRFQWYLIWYTVFGVIQGIAMFAFGYFSLARMLEASRLFHNRMLKSILHSPMLFFDTTPIGRIVNRFSSDVDVMDDRLLQNFRIWAIQIFSLLATIVVVCINTPYFITVLVPVMGVYLFLLKFYLPTARQVKRTESVLRSPIYNHFSETITGIKVIRAYRCSKRFMDDMDRRVDKNASFFFAATTATRWIGVRLQLLASILILAASVFALLTEDLSGGQVGLSLTYAFQITISLNQIIQAIGELEMNIISVERVDEYAHLDSEAAWETPGLSPAMEWPQRGQIDFNMYKTRYREGLDLVLRGITCTISPSEKVGIVGRTGAGKSSLTLSLFRLIEAAGGSIVIDGQNIADIGLHDLRSQITILPQDPVLFSGSLRSNLDPFNSYDDASIWKALECAHLKNTITGLVAELDYEAGEGGSNFSMGERQLICLARALLHKTKILILDEATAAVDLETDDLIQKTIRTEFSSCTILTIAHRLNTILDYDRVIVLSEGRILEFDSPKNLLKNTEGVFYKMACDAGLA